MIKLYDAASGEPCGILTDEQFAHLVDALEEESEDDQDYYLDRATLELLRERQLDSEVIRVLTAALGSRDEMDLAWELAADA
jgi:processive 1,2-diacylglycerol beta-glucosyltransferase